MKRGLPRGRKQGDKRGKEGVRKVAREALAQGLPTATIVALTELSVAEIESLKE